MLRIIPQRERRTAGTTGKLHVLAVAVNAGAYGVVGQFGGSGTEETVAHQHHLVAGNYPERRSRAVRKDVADKCVHNIVRDCHVVGWHVAKTGQVRDLMWTARLSGDGINQSLGRPFAIVLTRAGSFWYGWEVPKTEGVVCAADE